MNKNIIAVVIVAIVLVGGYFLLRGAPQRAPSVSQPSNQKASPPSSAEQAPAEEKNVVTYTDAGYSLATLRIKKGETVTFKNQGSQSMWTASAMHPTHRIYSGTSLDEHCSGGTNTAFDACKGILPSKLWSFTFDKAGTWKYHNHLNPGDTGTIVVE